VANTGALLGKTFQQFLIGVGEGGGRGGENFENSGERRVVVNVEDGNRQDGADAEAAGDVGIDAGVGLGIERELGLATLETIAGQTVAGLERDAQIGGEVSGGGAADHFIAADECDGGGAGAGRFGGANHEFVKNQVESEVGWKTGEDVLLERMGWIRGRLVRA
jgi:hypothetical protein